MRGGTLRLALIGLLLLCGCSGKPPAGGPPKDNPTTQSSAPQKPAAAEITAEVKTIAEIQSAIAAHQGKVVVVDLWALW